MLAWMSSPGSEPGHIAFPPTPWSVVLGAGEVGSEERRRNLEALAQLYWRPIFAWFRIGQGRTAEDARDLTQDFFVHLIESPLLARADPGRGRFRTYLKACLGNFAASAEEARRRVKRGGGQLLRSIDAYLAEHVDVAIDPGADPAVAIDREWRRVLVERAFAVLEEELAGRGQAAELDLFRAYHERCGLGDPPRTAYRELAERFALSRMRIAKILFRVRRRFRDVVYAQIRASVRDEASAREEFSDLFGAST